MTDDQSGQAVLRLTPTGWTFAVTRPGSVGRQCGYVRGRITRASGDGSSPPVANSGPAPAAPVGTFRGQYDGGTAVLRVTPAGGGMVNYSMQGPDTRGPGYVCGFPAQVATAPAGAGQVVLGNLPRGTPPSFTLTQTSSGWDFAAVDQQAMGFPGNCNYTGSIRR